MGSGGGLESGRCLRRLVREGARAEPGRGGAPPARRGAPRARRASLPRRGLLHGSPALRAARGTLQNLRRRDRRRANVHGRRAGGRDGTRVRVRAARGRGPLRARGRSLRRGFAAVPVPAALALLLHAPRASPLQFRRLRRSARHHDARLGGRRGRAGRSRRAVQADARRDALCGASRRPRCHERARHAHAPGSRLRGRRRGRSGRHAARIRRIRRSGGARALARGGAAFARVTVQLADPQLLAPRRNRAGARRQQGPLPPESLVPALRDPDACHPRDGADDAGALRAALRGARRSARSCDSCARCPRRCG